MPPAVTKSTRRSRPVVQGWDQDSEDNAPAASLANSHLPVTPHGIAHMTSSRPKPAPGAKEISP